MHSSAADRNPLDQLAEEVAARIRQGDRPSVSAYVDKHPELAHDRQRAFRGMLLMERFKPEDDEP
jgi:hypothetical protein